MSIKDKITWKPQWVRVLRALAGLAGLAGLASKILRTFNKKYFYRKTLLISWPRWPRVSIVKQFWPGWPGWPGWKSRF
jgi:hypothetical protein